MRYDLAAMAKRAGVRKREVVFAPILTTKAQATDLAAVYHRMLAPWYGARGKVEDAYDRELARVLQTDSIDDLTALFDELAEQVNRLVLELTPDLRDWAFRLERWHARKWAGTLLSGANVDVSYLLGPQDVQEPVSAFLGRNVALVKDISAQAQGRISDAVFRGLQARTPAREVGKEIAGALGMARKRANRVAADQAVKLASAFDRERQREAGLDVIRWKHSGKRHPRVNHLARNGKLYERDSGREVEFKGGKKTFGDETIPSGDHVGMAPFCGCVAQGVLIFEGEVL